ncbi:TonB-dependent receptor [Solitalea canadensis]|uniref:Outer membrane receptor for ferrienterochelin and colicins n=1 Tax=Solitalea canadensis (strain ATCC 29591 / DSM 3403 / JCM 21819 / LMG 8368 / NBRC 15130 / NCIMB 12057 / USAM 9D) TaxID=929556 RepID=H8KQA4_SOLCM|nr:TonB-dependent receptor [Solitalea canadensis]AFD06399.1 outer membrane receptor for ferrienterochelin and colicins [Solitalea canadensis DSM 3403]
MGYPLQSKLLKGSILTAIFLLVFIFNSFAQSVIKGKVIDDATNEPLPGVTISVKGSNKGTATNIDGSFTLKVASGTHTIGTSYVSYTPQEFDVTIGDGETKDLGVIKLATNAISMKEIVVSSNVAIDRKTPVAVSTIKAEEIQNKIGNNEFPEVLRSTPSTYVTKGGGGFGDSRINVRGFSQENMAVMVNGVPVNDMENSLVYWSNWAGLSDVASNVQLQRGLGATKLSVSAIGGTMNVVTKATEMKKGGSVGTSFGNDGYMKYNLSLSTGKLKNGLAFSFLGAYTQGDGYVDGTSFTGWNYFGSMAWEINKKHTLSLSVTGAPQQHNQRPRSNDYSTKAISVQDPAFPNDPKKKITIDTPSPQSVEAMGIKYNQSWGKRNGEEFTIANNFYHKPIAFLNHYWTISPKFDLSTVAYVSVGRGGGTGDLGGGINKTPFYNLQRTDDHLVRFDDIFSYNQGTVVDGFAGNKTLTPWVATADNGGANYAGKQVASSADGLIRRASMNEHNWWGFVSNLTYKASTDFTINGGVDYRNYKGLHYRSLDNSLGADYWYETKDANNKNKYVAAGDKNTAIDYNNNGYVEQIGGFASVEYSVEKLSAFVTGAASNTSYEREDLFLAVGDPNRMTPAKNYFGYTAKGGANYRVNDVHNVFVNVGTFSRAPFFNTVFAANSNKPIDILDIKNEKIYAVELGYGFRSKYISANVNFYNTQWDNKTIAKTNPNLTVAGVSYGLSKTVTTGLKALHQGVEIDFFSKPLEKLEISGMISLGNWEWKSNGVSNTYDQNNNIVPTMGNVIVYVDNVKVGDAAQTTGSLGASYEVIKGLKFRVDGYYADNLYAAFAPSDRNKVTDIGRQAWKLPSYFLAGTGLSYSTKISHTAVTFRGQVDNIFDKVYIAESYTDTPFTNRQGSFEIGTGGSSSNQVNMGFGRTFSLGMQVKF